MSLTIREMREEDARTFLQVHHAAVRGNAASDYPPAVIEAWAPLPITDDAIRKVQANIDAEYRLIAEIDDRVVVKSAELRACYVVPQVNRRGVGSALIREIERIAHKQGLASLELDSSLTAEEFYESHGYEVHERGEHVLNSGVRMACVKMCKKLAIEKL